VQVVNLLVTPEQAETLSLASHETRIQLVLRNPLDTGIAKTGGTAIVDLFGSSVKPPAAQPVGSAKADRRAARPRPEAPVMPGDTPVVTPPSPILVEIYHGTRRSEVKFQPEGEAKRQ
jgi:pilus assembly protein CpaB